MYPPPQEQEMYPPKQQSVYPPAQANYQPSQANYQPQGTAWGVQNQGYPVGYSNNQVYPHGNSNNSGNRPMTTASDNSGTFNSNSFSDDAVRRGFIRRVYLLLFVQLLFTFSVTITFSLVRPLKKFAQESILFFYLSFAVFIVTFIVLVCIKKVRRKHPVNIICLAIFTLAFTYMVAAISSHFTTYSVIVAAAMTALICFSISMFAIQTKIDFTKMNILIFLIVVILVYFGLSVLVVMVAIPDGRILDCVIGGLFAIVISIILVYDTQRIVGGKDRKYELDPEEYVYGALQLYMDVATIFLILLACCGNQG